jgi:hypothetical protein
MGTSFRQFIENHGSPKAALQQKGRALFVEAADSAI